MTTNKNDSIAVVPFYVMESEECRHRLTVQKMICALIMMVFLFIFSNAMWLKCYIENCGETYEPTVEEDVDFSEREDIKKEEEDEEMKQRGRKACYNCTNNGECYKCPIAERWNDI